MGRAAQACRPVDSCPKFGRQSTGNDRVNDRRQFVFGNCNWSTRKKCCIRSGLRHQRRRQEQQTEGYSHRYPPETTVVLGLGGAVVYALTVLSAREMIRMALEWLR